MSTNKNKLRHNKELAAIFDNMADCYRYLGPDQRFRAAAYKGAARTLNNMPSPVDDLADDIRKLEGLKNIGQSIAEKIIEYLTTGRIHTYEELKKQVPFGLLELLDIEGFGPSTLRSLHDELGVSNKEELINALERNKTVTVKGLGNKKTEQLKQSLKLESNKKRIPLNTALKIANKFLTEIRQIPGIHKVIIAGSIRRKKETIGDIDIVITADDRKWKRIINAIINIPMIDRVIAAGKTRASVILIPERIQADIRIVHDDEYGAALFYFTGSREHNIQLRTIAKKKGWKINEYGVFDIKSGKKLAGETEVSIYKLFGLPYIPPEKRIGENEISNNL